MSKYKLDYSIVREIRSLLLSYFSVEQIKQVDEDIIVPEAIREYNAGTGDSSQSQSPQRRFSKEMLDWTEKDSEGLFEQFIWLAYTAGRQSVGEEMGMLTKKLDLMEGREMMWIERNDKLQEELDTFRPRKVNPEAKKVVLDMLDELLEEVKIK